MISVAPMADERVRQERVENDLIHNCSPHELANFLDLFLTRDATIVCRSFRSVEQARFGAIPSFHTFSSSSLGP